MTRVLTLLILLFSIANVSAANVENLFQASVPVASQSESDRQKVTPDALKRVMIKVVGDRQTVEQADLQRLLADSERLVTRYSYQRINDEADITEPDRLTVTLNFDAQKVEQAINRQQLPIWGANRPDILFWLADDSDGQQRLLGESDNNKVLSLLRQHANRRGLPVLLPLMDLEEQAQINFDDISTPDESAMLSASERYDAKLIVLAAITGDSDNAGIKWQLISNGISDSWQSDGNLARAVGDGIDQLADQLGKRFSQRMGQPQKMIIEIDDVKDFDDYNRLLEYLQNLQGVSDINIGTLSDETLNLTMTIQSERRKFRELLAFSGFLTELGSSDGTERFRLLP